MLVILDRDGVINQDSEYYIKSPQEWVPIEGSLAAIARLNKAGHKVVVATNQSGVGRGLYTLETLGKIHEKMRVELAKIGGHLDGIYFCPHHPDVACDCRKPKPGLLWQIKKDYPEVFANSIFIGDSLRDLQAAKTSGIKSALVKTGKGVKTLASTKSLEGVSIYTNLLDFVNGLI